MGYFQKPGAAEKIYIMFSASKKSNGCHCHRVLNKEPFCGCFKGKLKSFSNFGFMWGYLELDCDLWCGFAYSLVIIVSGDKNNNRAYK